jgi:hypothetical protein
VHERPPDRRRPRDEARGGSEEQPAGRSLVTFGHLGERRQLTAALIQVNQLIF